jgi:hypothetical protein
MADVPVENRVDNVKNYSYFLNYPHPVGRYVNTPHGFSYIVNLYRNIISCV